MKKISIFIILVLAIGAIFYFWQDNKSTESLVTVSKEYTWTLSFQFSETDYINNINKKHASPLSLTDLTSKVGQGELWEYKFEDYGDMGILVTQIKDKTNGQDQKYWQYFVDGEQPQISADKYFPENGAHIEWKFIKSEF